MIPKGTGLRFEKSRQYARVIQLRFLFSVLTLKPLDSSALSVTSVGSVPGHLGALWQSCFIFTRSHQHTNGTARSPPSVGWSPGPADLVAKGFSIAADNRHRSPSITLVLVAEDSKHCWAPDAFDVPTAKLRHKTCRQLDLKQTTSGVGLLYSGDYGSSWQPETWSSWKGRSHPCQVLGQT